MVASVIFYFVSVALIAAVSYKLGVDMTMTKQAQTDRDSGVGYE